MKATACFSILALAVFIASCGGTILEELPAISESLQVVEITSLSVSTTTTSATISWTTSLSTTHLVEYGTVSGSYTFATDQSTTADTSHTETITGLTEGTTYYYRIHNYDSALGESVSFEMTFITSATPQAIQVTNLSASSSETSATITWTTNVSTTHLVEYGTVSGVYTNATLPSGTADTSHSVSLTGLSSGTTYYYRVHNYNSTYPDSVTSEREFTTTSPTPPTLEQKLRGIWIVGGLLGNTFTPAIGDVDLYDPVTDTWFASVTTLPTPVSFAGATSYGGNIYVIGGFDSSGNVRNIVQIYDVENNSWSTGTSMPPAAVLGRANIHAVAVNNRIYILGGTTGNATAPWAGPAATFRTWEYNPTGDSWTQKNDYTNTNFTSERLMLSFNDIIYNLGGRSAAATLNTAHDGFVVTQNNYTSGIQEVLLTSARTGISGILYTPSIGPSMIAIVGGFIAPLTNTTGNFIVQGTTVSTPTNLFQYLYFPFTSPYTTWTSATNPYLLSVGFSSAALYGSRMYVFGGTTLVTSAANGINDVYWFDLDYMNGAWTECEKPMPIGRYGHVAVTIK